MDWLNKMPPQPFNYHKSTQNSIFKSERTSNWRTIPGTRGDFPGSDVLGMRIMRDSTTLTKKKCRAIPNGSRYYISRKRGQMFTLSGHLKALGVNRFWNIHLKRNLRLPNFHKTSQPAQWGSQLVAAALEQSRPKNLTCFPNTYACHNAPLAWNN